MTDIPPKGSIQPPKAWFYATYITKQGAKVKNWKRRWFVLTSTHAYYFIDQTCKKHQGSIPLSQIQEVVVSTNKNQTLEIKTQGRTFFLTFEDRKEKEDWQQALTWAGAISSRAKVLEGMNLKPQDEIVTRCKSLMDQSMPITSTLLELIENKNSSATLFFGDLVKSIVDLMESVARVNKEEDNKSYLRQLFSNSDNLYSLFGDKIKTILNFQNQTKIQDHVKLVLRDLEFMKDFASKNQ